MPYFQKSKNCGENVFSVEVEQIVLKVRTKYLVKVSRIGGVMGRKRPPNLRESSFKFRH